MALEKLIKKVSTQINQVSAVVLAFQATTSIASLSINEFMPKDGQTIVFTSGNDDLIPLPYTVTARIIDFFMYAPITLRQNLHGNKVKWVSNATKKGMTPEVCLKISSAKEGTIYSIEHRKAISLGNKGKTLWSLF